MAGLRCNRRAWLALRESTASAILYVDDGAAESLKWAGGLRFALDELEAAPSST